MDNIFNPLAKTHFPVATYSVKPRAVFTVSIQEQLLGETACIAKLVTLLENHISILAHNSCKT
jgi:hypothetical protein